MEQVGNWIAQLTKIVGVAGFVYELVFVHPTNVQALGLTVIFASGGKALESILRGSS